MNQIQEHLDEQLSFFTIMKVSLLTFINHIKMYLGHALLSTIGLYAFIYFLPQVKELSGDGLTIFYLYFIFMAVQIFLIWTVEGCFYTLDYYEKIIFIPFKKSYLTWPAIISFALYLSYKSMLIQSALKYLGPLLLLFIPFLFFGPFLMLDRQTKFKKAFEISIDLSIFNLGIILKCLFFWAAASILSLPAGVYALKKLYQWFAGNNMLHHFSKAGLLYITILLITYGLLNFTYLYRLLSAGYFEDMQPIEEIEDWREGL